MLRFWTSLIVVGLLSCTSQHNPENSLPYGCYQWDFGFLHIDEVGRSFDKGELELAANSNTFRFRWLDAAEPCSKFFMEGHYSLDSNSVRFLVEEEYSLCEDAQKRTDYFVFAWTASWKREGRALSLCWQDCSQQANWYVFQKEPYDNANCVNSLWIE